MWIPVSGAPAAVGDEFHAHRVLTGSSSGSREAAQDVRIAILPEGSPVKAPVHRTISGQRSLRVSASACRPCTRRPGCPGAAGARSGSRAPSWEASPASGHGRCARTGPRCGRVCGPLGLTPPRRDEVLQPRGGGLPELVRPGDRARRGARGEPACTRPSARKSSRQGQRPLLQGPSATADSWGDGRFQGVVLGRRLGGRSWRVERPASPCPAGCPRDRRTVSSAPIASTSSRTSATPTAGCG